MRDCIFLAADEQIAAIIRGFLMREKYHLSLGCGSFSFDQKQDVIVDPNRDPGVYSRGFELLVPYTETHRRAVVLLDAAWDGAPTVDKIKSKIENDLRNHWDHFIVIVLEPEIEAWIWQDNHHVCTALGFNDYAALRVELETANFWKAGAPKPFKPKEAVEHALRKARLPRSAAIYQKIASKASTKQCIDPAFDALRSGLIAWFGVDA